MRRLLAAAAAALALPAAPAAPTGTAAEAQALEPPEEFSAGASQALGNLSAEFGRFRTAEAGRIAALAAKLQDLERSNHDLEASNLHELRVVEGLRRGNEALRTRAKALIAGNEELRLEMREARQKLEEAQDFSSQSIEGNNFSEATLLAAAEQPPLASTAPPEYGPSVAEPAEAEPVVTGALAGDVPSHSQAPAEEPEAKVTQAPVQRLRQTQTGAPRILQGAMPTAAPPGQLDGDVGYAEAFASGDVDGSLDGDSQESSPWESLLALRSRRGPARLRARASPEAALEPAAEAFAKFESRSVAQVQHLFHSAQKRVRRRRANLLARQGSLNATRGSLEATHARLASVVGKLETTHKHLEASSQRLLAILQHVAGAARAAEARSVAALADGSAPQRA